MSERFEASDFFRHSLDRYCVMDPSSSPKKSLPESCFSATYPESQHVQVPFLGACEQRYPFTISNFDADPSIIGPQSACFASAMTPIGSCALLNAPVESSVRLSSHVKASWHGKYVQVGALCRRPVVQVSISFRLLYGHRLPTPSSSSSSSTRRYLPRLRL